MNTWTIKIISEKKNRMQVAIVGDVLVGTGYGSRKQRMSFTRHLFRRRDGVWYGYHPLQSAAAARPIAYGLRDRLSVPSMTATTRKVAS